MTRAATPFRGRLLWRPVLASIVCSCLASAIASPASADPPVRAEHPRLFLVASDIPGLKTRCSSIPEVKKAYEMLRAFAYGESMQSNLWVAPDELSSVLVAYLVEDRDPKLLERARRYIKFFSEAQGDGWTRPRMLKALAHAYDWLHPDLTAGERRQCADRMSALAKVMREEYRHSDYNNHVYLERGPLLYAGLALWGDGTADDFARAVLQEAEPLLKEHFLPAVDQVGGGGDGGWHESMSYWSFFAYELSHQLEAWRTATGEDLFPAAGGLRGAAKWLLHATRPHDASMAPIADIETPCPWDWQETAYLPLLAARYRDPVAQRAASLVPPRHAARAWPFVLWHDPAIEPAPVESLPLGTLFRGIGWAAMRSSWGKDAAWAIFHCGDYYAGHEHSDQNSFVLSLRGDLLADAGEYGAKATEFHNTLLLGEGQRVYRTDPRQFFGPTEEGSELDTGDILAYEENPRFTFVVGDASNAYGQFQDGKRLGEKPLFVRRFIFLKPSTFVVDDLVRMSPAEAGARWLLHSREAPAVEGNVLRIACEGGEVTSKTLLPEKVSIKSSIEKAGRKEREYHRVDVVPLGSREDLRFLHVLDARPRGREETPGRTTLEPAKGGVELQLVRGGSAFRLLLPASAADAGEIEIKGANGDPILEPRVFPSGVLPYGPEGARNLERWDSAYRSGRRPGWDTGRPSTELRKAMEELQLKPCRSVELGCGTGTNVVYLSSLGFDATGIDIAPTALARARDKAEAAKVKPRFLLADVLALPRVGPYDLVFDRGCYHGVRRGGAREYVESLRRISRPGTRVLIIAGNANEPNPQGGPPRVKEEEIRADFSELFEIERLRETRFDTAEAEAKGAWAWSVLLRRK